VPGADACNATVVAVAGGLLLGIRLRFHNHAPEHLAIGLAFYQQAADELGDDHLNGMNEEGWGKSLKVLGRRGGYESGLGGVGEELKVLTMLK